MEYKVISGKQIVYDLRLEYIRITTAQDETSRDEYNLTAKK